jgi:hypothetical protein
VEFLSSFHINWSYASKIDKYLDFMQGVSVELLQPLLLNRLINFKERNYCDVDERLVNAFSMIENPIEAHDKLIVFAQWYPQFSALMFELAAKRSYTQLALHQRRVTTMMNILYMAALVDQKTPIDRELVKSWIPIEYLRGWILFSGNANTNFNVKSLVKERFGDLFTQETGIVVLFPHPLYGK